MDALFALMVVSHLYSGAAVLGVILLCGWYRSPPVPRFVGALRFFTGVFVGTSAFLALVWLAGTILGAKGPLEAWWPRALYLWLPQLLWFPFFRRLVARFLIVGGALGPYLLADRLHR